MELPQNLLESLFFTFTELGDLFRALGTDYPEQESLRIQAASDKQLPPAINRDVLGTMLGVSPSLITSFILKKEKHYGVFEIPKGAGKGRTIQAPRVALKVVQKWLSHHLTRKYRAPQHVHGFVPGRSHVTAANMHVNARWVASFDIKSFFQSTPISEVIMSIRSLGYDQQSAELVAELTTLNGALPQGAPSSPVLSNLVARPLDFELEKIATDHQLRVTRYADDITFSSHSKELPDSLETIVRGLFEEGPWSLSERKTSILEHPKRLLVHGLLVHGPSVRLPKRKRNYIRGVRHRDKNKSLIEEDIPRIKGELAYANYIEKQSS